MRPCSKNWNCIRFILLKIFRKMVLDGCRRKFGSIQICYFTWEGGKFFNNSAKQFVIVCVRMFWRYIFSKIFPCFDSLEIFFSNSSQVHKMAPIIIVMIILVVITFFSGIIKGFRELCVLESESVERSNGSSMRRVNTSSILRDCEVIRYNVESVKRLALFQIDYPKKDYCENSLCSICMEDFTEGEELVFYPCKHCYHNHCLKEWLRLKNSCPLCKLNIYGGSHATESTPLLHLVWVSMAYGNFEQISQIVVAFLLLTSNK